MRLFFAALLFYLLGFAILNFKAAAPEDKIEKLNQSTAKLMSQLVQTKYFRLIRLNLQQQCPLSFQNKICKSKSCTVCRCDEKDIPSFWSKTDRVISTDGNKDIWQKQRQQKSTWVWHVEDEQNDEGEYFDIHTNIQSFTNYNGTSIWALVYEENCFQGKNNFQQMCHEEKILYKIISGLHTSISTHLSRFYKNITSVSEWADLKSNGQAKFHFNHSEYKRRVLDHPERINNLLFIYQIFAKAIKEISPYLMNNFTVQSDDIAQDLKASQLLKDFLFQLDQFDLSNSEKETLKFFTTQNSKVKEYQNYIHNISRILNCVECEKCKLFGKMQTYGVGTALKILLGYKNPYKRNQIVALFNAFNKLTMSVETYFEHLDKSVDTSKISDQEHLFQLYSFIGGAVVLLIFIGTQIDVSGKVKKSFKHVFPKDKKLKI